MKLKYNKISDSGHGWLKVPIKDLEELGITKKITKCSYISQSGKWAYLEEDCDAVTFAKALMKKFGWNEKEMRKNIKIDFKEVKRLSQIRNYPSFKG